MAFKMLLIKGSKPVGAAVLGFAAYKGYAEWQNASSALKISKDKVAMEKVREIRIQKIKLMHMEELIRITLHSSSTILMSTDLDPSARASSR